MALSAAQSTNGGAVALPLVVTITLNKVCIPV